MQKFLMASLKFVIACFERFIRFLNKHAFIEIALTGKSFCPAAKDGFYMILNNPVRYALVTGMGSFIMFLGKLFIALMAGIFTFGLILYLP